MMRLQERIQKKWLFVLGAAVVLALGLAVWGLSSSGDKGEGAPEEETSEVASGDVNEDNVLSLQNDVDNSTDSFEVWLERAVPDWRRIQQEEAFQRWLKFGYQTDGDSEWCGKTRRQVLDDATQNRLSTVVAGIFEDYKEAKATYEEWLDSTVPEWRKDLRSRSFWRWASQEAARKAQIEQWRDSLNAYELEKHLRQYRWEMRGSFCLE